MTINQKYKLGDLAKDLGMKSGELIELLAKNGFAGRKVGTQLDSFEFDVIMNSVTSSRQIENIDDYLSGKISITVPKTEPVPEPVAPPPAEAAPAETIAEQPAASAPSEASAPQNDNEQPSSQKQQDGRQQQGDQPQQPKRPQQQNQQQSGRPQQNQPQGNRPQQGQPQGKRPQQGQPQGNRPQQDQPQGNRPQQDQPQGNRPQQGQPQGNRPQQGQPQGNRPQQGQPQGNRPQQGQPQGNRPQQGQPQGNRPQQGQPQGSRPQQGQPQGNRPQQGQPQQPQGSRPAAQGQRQSDRSQQQLNAVNAQQAHAAAEAKAKADERTAAREAALGARFEKRPDFSQQKPKQRSQKPAAKIPQPVVIAHTPSEEPAVSIVEARSQHRGKASETRVIDTRTTSVDLAKYDEKLDKFVPDSAKNMSGEKQKLKKQNNRPAPGESRRRGRISNSEAEKLKRLEQLERAKKRPLHITLSDEILVGELASKLKLTASAVIKKLISMGFMANINQALDFETAALAAEELGAKVSREVVVTIEEKLFDDTVDKEENLAPRPPVVVVMGHVDHGKTSLLDAIRHTNITLGEAGGITQHIGASRVNINGRDITFLDTPGHEAFTAMRARGAKATDIAILVVAADDGIMPQTVEAINHAKAAGLDIIVAINKMDKPSADPERVKQALTKYDLVPEEWGGDVICVPVSAVTGQGIPELLESVLLVAEVKDLRANPNRRAKGIIIEAKLDRGRGPVATVLIQNGTLNYGDVVIAGTAVGRVRAMTDDKGETVKVAGPSDPVEIIGLSEVPAAGDEFNAVEDERMARELAEQRRTQQKEEEFKANSKVSLDDLFAQISEGAKELNIIVKGDVDGSAEAVKTSLLKLSTDEVKVKIIHTAVGGITEGDVMLASASNAIIVGFNVRPDKGAIDSAERQKVDIRTYRIIYECIEEITAALKGMLAPTYKESLLGHAQVRQVIRVPKVGTIAGSYVQDGKITRSAKVRVIRDGVVIFEDQVDSLRRFKDDVREVAAGYECGIGLERFNDLKENDMLEAYEMVEVAK